MLSRIPVWVFVLLIALLWFGYRQSLTRRVSPVAVGYLALAMIGLSLQGVIATFGARPVPVLGWLLGVVMALSVAQTLFAPRGLALAAGRVLVPGSWVPMVMLMGIFSVRFALGFAQGMGRPVGDDLRVAAASALVLGLLSGGFVVRAWAIRRFAQGAVQPV